MVFRILYEDSKGNFTVDEISVESYDAALLAAEKNLGKEIRELHVWPCDLGDAKLVRVVKIGKDIDCGMC